MCHTTIHRFWFNQIDESGHIPDTTARRWFVKDADFDHEITHRFSVLHRQAISGSLDHWAETIRGRLCLILVLDQFSRNMYRNSAKAFASDAKALALTKQGLESRHDLALSANERAFFYLLLEHSESQQDQITSVTCFTRLARNAPVNAARMSSYLDYARRHQDIINRFGRFPHRNQVLGRASTPEEQAYLAQPGSGF